MGRAIAALLSVSFTTGCYTTTNTDMFPVQTAALSPEALGALSTTEQHVEHILIDRDRGTIDAYRVHLRSPLGTIVFFGGNGNEIEPVLRVVMPHLRRLNLDLLLMNYWPLGQPRPDVESTRVAAGLVIRKAIEISPGPVCVVGHSLGAWFAIDAAARPDVSGVALAAVGTTPADLTKAQAGFWRHFFVSKQEASLRALDGVSLAKQVITPIVIVTSTGDSAIPPTLSAQVFAALPPALHKQLLTLHGISHGGYLRSTQFWDAASEVLCRDGSALPSRSP